MMTKATLYWGIVDFEVLLDVKPTVDRDANESSVYRYRRRMQDHNSE